MAFNNNTPRLEFTATSGQTEFVFNFKVFNTSDIVVYQTPTGQTPDDAIDILVEATDYTVVIDGDDGGTVTLVSGATLNDRITLLRNLPFTRETDYQTGGDLLESTLDEDQDYQTYLSQQLEASKDRFLNIPASVQNVSATLPAPVSNAYFKWDSAGTAIENDTTIPDAVTTSAANAAAAAASATQAELYEWEAEAERLTADSYATEAEDTFVNLITSNGDGTFTYTPTTEYSALHYKNKAQASAASIDLNLLSPRATTITPPTDADYTLTATENGYGRLVLDLSNWTQTRNIIVDDTERSFIVDNSAGSYTATVKTSAGTGIAVDAGATMWLLCDGTNVIESVDSSALEIASTAQAQAGTDDTTAITPLKLREGLNASGEAPIYACRAWVNFDGTGTVAIRASGNVSSITDNGVGNYTVNFATAIPDANYNALSTCNVAQPTGLNAGTVTISTNDHTVSSLEVFSIFSGGQNTTADYTDKDSISIAILR